MILKMVIFCYCVLFVVVYLPIIFYFLIEWDIRHYEERKYKARVKRIKKGKERLEDLFDAYQEFCPVCLTHEHWWSESTVSDRRCPSHLNNSDTIIWMEMTKAQKKKACKKMNSAWLQKFGKHFFNQRKRKLYE